MTNRPSFSIGSRTYKTALSLNDELSFLTNKNYLFNLNQQSVVKVSGQHAAEFLQGQLSCDIRLVTASTMQHGALCNLKGRVLALLDVIYYDDCYWLILPTDLVQATLKSLEKTAMLSQVTLELMNKINVWGLFIQSHHDILPTMTLPKTIQAITSTASSCCYQVSENDYLLLTEDNDPTLNLLSFKENHQIKSCLAWHFRQLHQRRFSIYPETRGLFLPHRLNMQNTGYLSFNKGCYKGQEIIARTHYRATLKHEFILATIQSNTPMILGATILDPKTKSEVGELVDYCPIDDHQHYVIACSVLLERHAQFQIENDPLIHDFN